MTTEVTSEKTTVGFVEYYNHDRLIGWAVGADPATSVSLTLFVDGSPKASFAANDLRPDLRHLGNRSGKHGFDVALPRRTICEPFEVVAADGISLPVFPNAAGLDGWLDRSSSDGVFGWVWRVGDTEEKLTVEILLDSTVIGAVAADVFREDLNWERGPQLLFPAFPEHSGQSGFSSGPHRREGGWNPVLPAQRSCVRTGGCASRCPNEGEVPSGPEERRFRGTTIGHGPRAQVPPCRGRGRDLGQGSPCPKARPKSFPSSPSQERGRDLGQVPG